MSSSTVKNRKSIYSCVLCPRYPDYRTKALLLDHFRSVHKWILNDPEKLEFDSREEFAQFKSNLEHQTNSYFSTWGHNVHTRAHPQNPSLYTETYLCDRTGINMKYITKRGTQKIGGYCPASIELECDWTSPKVTVNYYNCHFHALDPRKLEISKPIKQKSTIVQGEGGNSTLLHDMMLSAKEAEQLKLNSIEENLPNYHEKRKLDVALNDHDYCIGPSWCPYTMNRVEGEGEDEGVEITKNKKKKKTEKTLIPESKPKTRKSRTHPLILPQISTDPNSPIRPTTFFIDPDKLVSFQHQPSPSSIVLNNLSKMIQTPIQTPIQTLNQTLNQNLKQTLNQNLKQILNQNQIQTLNQTLNQTPIQILNQTQIQTPISTNSMQFIHNNQQSIVVNPVIINETAEIQKRIPKRDDELAQLLTRVLAQTRSSPDQDCAVRFQIEDVLMKMLVNDEKNDRKVVVKHNDVQYDYVVH